MDYTLDTAVYLMMKKDHFQEIQTAMARQDLAEAEILDLDEVVVLAVMAAAVVPVVMMMTEKEAAETFLDY